MVKQMLTIFLIAMLGLIPAGCGMQKASGETVKTETTAKSAATGSSQMAPKAQPAGAQKGTTDMKTTTYRINGVDFKMILVEPGTFTMGSSDTHVEFSESPAHKVTLTKPYLIGETEVTEALWNAVMGKSGGRSDLPKTSVTWPQCAAFAERLTKKAREAGIIDSTVRFALPTEAQWEFAAKGGNRSKGYRYAGSNSIDEVAVTRENSGSDSPIAVKTKQPNELGIYDMSGNAYEWVDAYAGRYSPEAQTDPVSHPSRKYVKRDGSNYHNFNSESYLFTTTGRYFYGSTDWTIGCRLALVYEQ